MKKMTLAIISLAMLLTMLVGCSKRITAVMDSWIGHHYSELIASWGPPQQVFDDGNGGRILVYQLTRTFMTPGTVSTNSYGRATAYDNFIWGSVNSYSTYTPPQTHEYTSYRMFWIDKDGMIYNRAWKGY